ncbi:hypothetical protein MMC31_007162 [Peltigera leucophlebia]|nr:hypothetical protein [Peltigera leucophlebia]
MATPKVEERDEQLEKAKEVMVKGLPSRGVIVASGNGFGNREFLAAELEAAVRQGVALESSPVRPLGTSKQVYPHHFVNVPGPKLASSADQPLPSETFPAILKSVKKIKMTVRIRPFKGLQNGIENTTELLEELNWAYRREYKYDEPNLEDNAEQWYNEVDDETRIFELRLELANLKQGETENIADFITRADIMARKLPGSEADGGIAVTRGILDPEHKERLLFECASSKNFTFSNVKTLAKALYFSRGKNSPFDPAYKESRSVGLPLPIQSTEELVRQCIPTLVQGVRMLNSTLIYGTSQSSFRNASYPQQCYVCDEPGHYAQQYSGQSYPRQQYNAPYYSVQHHAPPASIESRPVQDVRTALNSTK